MADFSIQSTQLSDAQGRGTQPLSPVEERVVNTSPMGIIQDIGSIFVKGLKDNAKEQAEARKKAVLDSYAQDAGKINEGLMSGNLNASRAATMSRALFNKYLVSNSEYTDDLTKLRNSFHGGTELSEAERQVQAEQKQMEADIDRASSLGYQFYPGMSEQAKMANIDAYKAARRVEEEYDRNRKRVEDQYGDNAEARAATQEQRAAMDYVAKEQAFDGTRAVAAANFDAIVKSANDLIDKVGSGNMPFEQAAKVHAQNIQRITASITSVAGKFPEAASMWRTVFTDMDATVQKLMDPKVKSESEVKLLRDQLDKMVLQTQLMAVTKSPKLLTAMAASASFRGDPSLILSTNEVVKDWLGGAIGVDPTNTPAPIVGTANDKEAFTSASKLLKNLSDGKIPEDQKPKAEREALNLINKTLKEASDLGGSIPANTLKNASAFFSSPEFGKLAVEGKIDKQTAANAQHVFQTAYEPAVRTAILSKLQEPVSRTGEPLLRSVEFKLVGGKVVMQGVDMEPAGNAGWIDRGLRGHDVRAGQKDLKAAEDGLNQLIRLHAHLEGTTDYAGYWEKNKHQLMPDVFPDPAKLKPGTAVDGYRYIGGNVNDKRNWIAEPKPAAK